MTTHVILDAGGVICLPHMGTWLTTNRFDEIIGETRLRAAGPDKIRMAMERSAKIYLDESMPIADESYEFAARRNYFLDIAGALGWTLTDREADALARDMTENDARYDFYDDAREGVRRLGEKYHLGLLSDAMPSIRRVMENAGYMDLFDAAVISCEVAATKPDERMYRAIAEKLEAAPENCVFIDDRINNLEGARRFGMRAIHMARDGAPTWDGPHAADLFEAARLIE